MLKYSYIILFFFFIISSCKEKQTKIEVSKNHENSKELNSKTFYSIVDTIRYKSFDTVYTVSHHLKNGYFLIKTKSYSDTNYILSVNDTVGYGITIHQGYLKVYEIEVSNKDSSIFFNLKLNNSFLVDYSKELHSDPILQSIYGAGLYEYAFLEENIYFKYVDKSSTSDFIVFSDISGYYIVDLQGNKIFEGVDLGTGDLIENKSKLLTTNEIINLKNHTIFESSIKRVVCHRFHRFS